MKDFMKKQDFIRGLIHGIPICLGSLAVSFSFGILAAGAGLSILETVLISMTNMTSAGQLAGVPILVSGGSMIELAITQLVINLRYALMSVSLSQKFDGNVRLADRFLIAFGNTDEVFAVSASQPHSLSTPYMYGLILTPYIAWAVGTLLGAVAGHVLPPFLLSALGITFYSMFIAIVVPVMRQHRPTALCVLLTIALSCAFYYIPFLQKVPSGFVVIICAVAASALFAWLRPIGTEEKGGAEA